MTDPAIRRPFEPEVVGGTVAAPVIVCGGMGGSSFPARVLRYLGVTPHVLLHQDYGLPESMPEGSACIALSYSGETAETLSFAEEALARGMPVAVVAGGGRLLALARERGLPHAIVPQGTVPREAIVPMTRALLALIGEADPFAMESDESGTLEAGEALARFLDGGLPIFYSSARNEVLGGFAKILMNETAKMPAFANVLPEMNHNELQGYDLPAGTERADALRAVFFMDESDDARVIERMGLTERLLASKGVLTMIVTLAGSTRASRFLHGSAVARNAAHALASEHGLDPDATPLIDELKRML